MGKKLQGRPDDWEDKSAKTIWKRNKPADPPKEPEFIQITHVKCGTSWQIRRGAGSPTCSQCGRI